MIHRVTTINFTIFFSKIFHALQTRLQFHLKNISTINQEGNRNKNFYSDSHSKIFLPPFQEYLFKRIEIERETKKFTPTKFFSLLSDHFFNSSEHEEIRCQRYRRERSLSKVSPASPASGVKTACFAFAGL